MMPSATLRERLPSAIAAIALQAGMLALLAFSFAVVRHVGVEKETFLTLPPPAQTLPAAMVIDARGRPKPLAAAPDRPAPPVIAAPPVIGAPALPGTAPQAAGAPLPCIPAGQARPAYRVACPQPPPLPQAQNDDIPLHPESHVKDEARWQAEMAHKNDPLGVSLGPGVSVAPGGVGLQLTIQDPLCKLAGLFIKLHCGAVPVYHTSTDAQFQAARAAVQARTQSIYGKPVLASTPQTGGGDEKSTVSGSTGTAAVGTGPASGTGGH